MTLTDQQELERRARELIAGRHQRTDRSLLTYTKYQGLIAAIAFTLGGVTAVALVFLCC